MLPFGLFTNVFTPAAFSHTLNEALAIASHETHVRGQHDAGLTIKQDPSLVDWDELPELLRESNRLFADSIPAKLSAIGCAVGVAPLVDPHAPPVVLTDAEVERLAPMEHERWSEDMQRHLGYRRGAGPKDTSRGLHPHVGVPFDEIPRENQDKDRSKVRSLPEILARAGLRSSVMPAMTRRADGAPRPIGRWKCTMPHGPTAEIRLAREPRLRRPAREA